MSQSRHGILLLCLFGALALAGDNALSHEGQGAVSTVAGCNALSDKERREACLACIRSGPFHYHPAAKLCHRRAG